MKEYIERGELESILHNRYDRLAGLRPDFYAGYMMAFHTIEDDVPTAADVVEVRHGRWRFGKDLPDSFGSMNKNKYHLYCSECRHQAFNKSADNDCDFDEDTPFCPWCGAKMDVEEI